MNSTYSSSDSSTSAISYNTINGYMDASTLIGQLTIKKEKSISPTLYFKSVKMKMGILENMRLNSRIKKLEKAFDVASNNGQIALSEKLLTNLVIQYKESYMYAKGFKLFIEREDLHKHKNNIKDGHISDTAFEYYTRVIPKNVLDKKKKAEGLFDNFVIYHYYNRDLEQKAEKSQKMTREEIQNMKDPILFGRINENDRLYFIADWEDEYCNLSFNDIVDVIGREDNELIISNIPNLILE